MSGLSIFLDGIVRQPHERPISFVAGNRRPAPDLFVHSDAARLPSLGVLNGNESVLEQRDELENGKIQPTDDIEKQNN